MFTYLGQSVLCKSLLVLLFLLMACQQKTLPEKQQAIVAQVGPEVITAREFKESYESGFAHLKQGPDRKRAYLEHMIREYLLALEGYREGLDRSPGVRQKEAQLLQELLLETLIEQDIQRHIRVSQEEIREAINRSKVLFKFRYWVEREEQRAREIARTMRQKGYAAVVDELLQNQRSEFSLRPELLESDYVNSLDISPELLEAIQDLPIGEISDPVELNGQFYIFQVLDIRRQAITTNEYIEKAPRFEQIVYYQKLEKQIHRYVRQLMEGKQVVTDGEAFARLGRALREWLDSKEQRSLAFAEAVTRARPEQTALWALKSHLDQPFFRWKHGQVTAREFLHYFRPAYLKGKPGEPVSFADAVHRAVAQTIRDYFLIREARRKNYHLRPEVERELRRWRHKWVFQEKADQLLAKFRQTHAPQPDSGGSEKTFDYASQPSIRQSFAPAVATLKQFADSLRAVYPVQIHQAVLDTIQVVDFQKSRWATTLFFRAGRNRLAFPIVDPLWEPGPLAQQEAVVRP